MLRKSVPTYPTSPTVPYPPAYLPWYSVSFDCIVAAYVDCRLTTFTHGQITLLLRRFIPSVECQDTSVTEAKYVETASNAIHDLRQAGHEYTAMLEDILDLTAEGRGDVEDPVAI